MRSALTRGHVIGEYFFFIKNRYFFEFKIFVLKFKEGILVLKG